MVSSEVQSIKPIHEPKRLVQHITLTGIEKNLICIQIIDHKRYKDLLDKLKEECLYYQGNTEDGSLYFFFQYEESLTNLRHRGMNIFYNEFVPIAPSYYFVNDIRYEFYNIKFNIPSKMSSELINLIISFND